MLAIASSEQEASKGVGSVTEMNLVATSDEDQLSKMKANQDSSSSLFADNATSEEKTPKAKRLLCWPTLERKTMKATRSTSVL